MKSTIVNTIHHLYHKEYAHLSLSVKPVFGTSIGAPHTVFSGVRFAMMPFPAWTKVHQDFMETSTQAVLRRPGQVLY